MRFQLPERISFDVELDSGKVDSFEELQNLLDRKEDLSNELAIAFANKLSDNANDKLHTTIQPFVNAITVENGQVILDTSDFVVNMVENGVGSFDMKPGFLASPKVKVGKNGQKFITIPVSKFKGGRYNWRDRQTGKFDKGSNPGGDVEFRIVSENSPESSWQHPGHPGFNFIDQTLDNIDDQIETILDDKINAIIERM